MVLTSEIFPLLPAVGVFEAACFNAFEPALDFFIRAATAQGLKFFLLGARHRLTDVKNLRRSLFDDEIIHTDCDLLIGLDRPLVLVTRLSNLFLRVPTFDGLDHSAHLIELLEVFERALFHVESLLFDEVASAEWINRLRHARLEGNDLLRAQCDARGLFGGQRQRFVVSVGM